MKSSIKESFISGEDLAKSRELVKASRDGANQCEWLYQCTCFEALKSIIENREIWLTNLKKVNDKEEEARINIPEYETAYFVGCFTYDFEIGQDNWAEYGRNDEGIIYGFKKEWVKKEAEFMLDSKGKFSFDDYLKIYPSAEEAEKITEREREINHRECYPYYFFDFDFYKIIYDDDLRVNMDCSCQWDLDFLKLENGRFISTDLPGIIKKKRGQCERPGESVYIKNWEDEKEVRLKVGVKSDHGILPPDIWLPRLAVKLTDNAFETMTIGFNPNMYEDNKEQILIELRELLPYSKIKTIE